MRKVQLERPRDQAGPSRLIVPDAIDCVVGQRTSIYLDSLYFGSAQPAFTLEGGLGALEADRWTWLPEATEEGTKGRVRLRAADGGHVSWRTVVRPALAQPGQSLRVLVMGDSLSDAGVPAHWVEYADDLLVAAGVDVTWLGDRQSSGQSAHIYHAATAGSSFLWWIGTYTGLPTDSPFFVNNKVDPYQYGLNTWGGDGDPDVVISILGTNSYGTVNIGTGTEAAEWAAIHSQMDTLYDAIREAWPNAYLCPAYGFPVSQLYRPLGGTVRERKQIFAEWARANFRARQHAGQRLALPPTVGPIDPVAGFPPDNDHFNSTGAAELGRQMYCFLRRFCQ